MTNVMIVQSSESSTFRHCGPLFNCKFAIVDRSDKKISVSIENVRSLSNILHLFIIESRIFASPS